MTTIAVIEDDENQREFLNDFLTENGFVVHTAGSGAQASKLLEKLQPDITLLDLGLPDIDGGSLFSQLRKDFPDLPIIILTARNASSDIVKGFNLGADDYITKPYNTEELLARVKARLKHAQISSKLKVNDLELNVKTFEVKRDDKKIKLTPKEFKLLEYLMVNKGRVLSRDMILSRIWLYSPDMETRAVDVYIGYLRKKVDNGFKKKLIQSVRGFGYMIKD